MRFQMTPYLVVSTDFPQPTDNALERRVLQHKTPQIHVLDLPRGDNINSLARKRL
jgi:hypothetical protein